MIYEIQKTRKEAPRPLDVSNLSDQDWREKDLENYLFQQSRPGEKADLVAFDREGELWLFELKKVAGQAENLLQVMRYSQIFGSYEIGDLDALYRESHTGATESSALRSYRHDRLSLTMRCNFDLISDALPFGHL